MQTPSQQLGTLLPYLSTLVLRVRWIVLLVWAVVLLTSAVFAPRVFSVLKGGGFDVTGTESDIALEKLEVLGLNQTTMEAVFHSETFTFRDPPFQAAVRSSLEGLRDIDLISRITAPQPGAEIDQVSPDGHTAFAIIWIDADLDTAQELVPDIKEALGQRQDIPVYLTGSPVIFREIERVSEQDIQRGEMITLPVVLVLLLLVFGSVVAAVVPVVLGLFAVTITIGIIYLIAQYLEMSIFTVNIASFLGLGVAIDYSLLMVSRFREEISSWEVPEAIAVTMNTAGKAILFSAMTTMLGLGGLLLFDISMLRSIGLGGVVVVGVSLLVALTLMPVLLSLLGHRINALSLFPHGRRRVSGFWRGTAHRVMRYPLFFIIPVTVFLILLGMPFLRINLGAPAASTLPPSYDSRKGWDLLIESFGPGRTTPFVIAIESTEGVFRPEALRELARFTQKLKERQDVTQVQSIVDLDPHLTFDDYTRLYQNRELLPADMRGAAEGLASETITLVRVFTTLDGNSREAEELVDYIRSIQPKGNDLEAWVSGYTAGVMDARDVLYGQFPRVIAVIIGSIYLALLLLFRSVVLPLKAVIMNGVSVFASYGALVFIFQDGHFQDLLGFKATNSIDLILPILLFSILFGLSMDYEVFLLSRIKERYDETGDNTGAVVEGLERTGRIITSAALVVILVLSGFAFGDLVIIKSMGVSMAVAIAIDVTIVRVVLVPALMRLLGDLNWWAPRFLQGRPVAAGTDRT